MATNEVTAVELKQRLNEMSQQMKEFSQGLRSLYAENAVSNAQSMESFRNVRDAMRRDATVFVSHLLPVTSMVVLNLSSYFDYFLGLDFEDWQKFIKDIIEQLEKNQNACQLLIQMTESLIVSLKKGEDEAMTSIVKMDELTAKLEKKMESLTMEAADKEKKAGIYNGVGIGVGVAAGATAVGAVLAPFTFGASLAASAAVAVSAGAIGGTTVALATDEQTKLELEAKSVRVQVESERENAGKARRVTQITREELIPALAKLIKGLEVWQSFFDQTKGELIKMSNFGQTAVKKQEAGQNMEMYYKMMKNNAAKINASCDCFSGALGKVSMNPVSTTHTELSLSDHILNQCALNS
jgi:hypothetical protein